MFGWSFANFISVGKILREKTSLVTAPILEPVKSYSTKEPPRDLCCMSFMLRNSFTLCFVDYFVACFYFMIFVRIGDMLRQESCLGTDLHRYKYSLAPHVDSLLFSSRLVSFLCHILSRYPRSVTLRELSSIPLIPPFILYRQNTMSDGLPILLVDITDLTIADRHPSITELIQVII